MRNDPQGIWADRIFRFPGRGTDYPLPPGSIALIAKSAIDHRQLYPFAGVICGLRGHGYVLALEAMARLQKAK